MTLEEFFEKLKTEKITEYIVRVKYKYNFEKEYTYSNELLLISNGIDYEWNNDWIECQTDIEVLDYIAVDDVRENFHGEWEVKDAIFEPYIIRDDKERECVVESGAYYVCNQCGYIQPHRENFCSNCGADMRGEKK